MKKLFLLAFVSSAAFAEVPPPGTSRKGPIAVTPEGQTTSTYDLSSFKVIPREDSRKVQKKIDALRARVRELEAELAHSNAEPREVEVERVVERVVEKENTHRTRIGIYAGLLPDGVKVDENGNSRTATIHESGSAIGVSYGYLFTDRFSFNAFGGVTTRSTYIATGFVGLGYDL